MAETSSPRTRVEVCDCVVHLLLPSGQVYAEVGTSSPGTRVEVR